VELAVRHWRQFSDVQNPVYNFPDTGRFTVALEIFNQFGCSDTVSHTVIITPSFTIYVPNAFSPNNDGVNDIFIPQGIGWRDYELRVFSRSGNQVFSSFDPLIGWNGKVRESETYAMPDVYVWRVYVRDKLNRIQDYVGTVTLVH
jgi:gliding motility-associated-like protein